MIKHVGSSWLGWIVIFQAWIQLFQRNFEVWLERSNLAHVTSNFRVRKLKENWVPPVPFRSNPLLYFPISVGIDTFMLFAFHENKKNAIVLEKSKISKKHKNLWFRHNSSQIILPLILVSNLNFYFIHKYMSNKK